MLNVKDTILSQYANSPTILSLINSMNDAIDPSVNIDDFYNKVWNVLTAEGYGLDIWGRIVGVSRVLTSPNTGYFGFKQGNYLPFGQGIFYSSSHTSTQNAVLSDDIYRKLILVKALDNISDRSIYSYNKMLMLLFPGRGNAYCNDLGNMQMRFTFEFPLEPFEILILKQSGAISPPTGVKIFLYVFDRPSTFGFKQQNLQTLGHGTFAEGFL
jgi:hypothetical protein